MSARDDDGQALAAVLSDTGPAFPGTLRDWFAGQALVGMAPVVCRPGCQYEPQEGDPRSVEEFTAAVVYSLADAMLAERAKGAERNVCGEDCPDCHPPTGAAEYDPAALGRFEREHPADEVERGQAPDPTGRSCADTVAAQPAPAFDDTPGDVCGHRDPSSPRVCDLQAGHDGAHNDSWLPTGETERRQPVCGANTVDFDGQNFVCHRPRKHAGDHYDNLSDHRWSVDGERPGRVPHCLNCGLILDSHRPYCDVCGCGSTRAEGFMRCREQKGHDGEHRNGGVSWGGSV